MNAQILAILTVFIIGIVSFLIGFFATKSFWQKKIDALKEQNNVLEQNNQNLVHQTKELKKAAQSSENLLKHATDENDQLQEVNERLKIERSNLNQDLRTLKDKTKPEKVERLLEALGQEKQERVLLLAELNELKALHMGTAAVNTETVVKAEKPNLKYRLTNIFQRIGLRSPKEPDRLIAINGVTPHLAAGLNKIGVFNYKQLGLLEEDDLETIAEAISILPELIIKDNWIGQARRLYKEKYTS